MKVAYTFLHISSTNKFFISSKSLHICIYPVNEKGKKNKISRKLGKSDEWNYFGHYS